MPNGLPDLGTRGGAVNSSAFQHEKKKRELTIRIWRDFNIIGILLGLGIWGLKKNIFKQGRTDY